jgi:D-alanyl-D-alanine carboxypeptidase/D-alanyl-D-alanine-endopeptidase (penicillin-binding protein 4)
LAVAGTVLIALGLVLAVSVLSSAHDAARATPPPSSAPELATPLWSPRRIPRVVTAAAVEQRFSSVIAGFAAPGRCVAVDGPDGPLARVAPALTLAPASTEKLLTGAAALSVLGTDHTFTTAVTTTARVSDGVVHGDVYLVGGGDPVLSTPAYRSQLASNPGTAATPTTNLDDLAAALARAGVHHIEGAIVADDHRFDTSRYLPSLKPSERSDIGPLGALTVDGGRTSTGVAASDPALTTAVALQTLLSARAITVDGPTRRGTQPSDAHELAHVRSPRLDAIVENMLTVSDNYTAEMLVRSVGVAVEHDGSTAAGLRAVIAQLQRLGVPTPGVHLVDGSGLSPEDRVTCPALLGAVELGSRQGERALRVGLPIAARTGTLATRFLGDPLAGKLRAKTGHIDGVVGLAGVVPTADGELAFAFVANGDFSTAGGESLQDQVAHLVASYPVVPDPARLVPAPIA